MYKWQYEDLQNRLTQKMKNNPYRRTGCFKHEESYKEGILAAKSIISDFYHRYCEEKNDGT